MADLKNTAKEGVKVAPYGWLKAKAVYQNSLEQTVEDTLEVPLLSRESTIQKVENTLRNWAEYRGFKTSIIVIDHDGHKFKFRELRTKWRMINTRLSHISKYDGDEDMTPLQDRVKVLKQSLLTTRMDIGYMSEACIEKLPAIKTQVEEIENINNKESKTKVSSKLITTRMDIGYMPEACIEKLPAIATQVEEVENIVAKLLGEKKMAKSLKNFEEFENINNKESKTKVLSKRTLFIEDYFSDIVYEDTSSLFKTFFSDNQVVKILEKVSNRNIRSLVWEFQSLLLQKSDRFYHLKFVLHTICNKLLNLYGTRMLSFIHDLSVVPRTENISKNHSDLFSLNIDDEDIGIETIMITKDYSVKYLGFEISEYDNKPYMIVCDDRGFLQGRINELGYIEDEFINRMRFNIFEFIDEGSFSYYNAVLNTHCSVCGRELTNHDSVYYGIGPVCRGDVCRY